MTDQQMPWVGWYTAVEDLIPTFEPTTPATWQLERLPRHITESLLVGSKDTSQQWGKGYRIEHEPSFTITALNRPAHFPLVFVLDGNNKNSSTLRAGHEPIFTITAIGNRTPIRASIAGRWLRISTRGLARFQSVPDSYILPDRLSLAGTIIGNMVPPLLMQRIIEANL